jgi:hypothetical protein
MRLFPPARSLGRKLVPALIAIALAALCSCNSQHLQKKPSIEITQSPPASIGGPIAMAEIAGRVHDATPGQQVILYAHSGVWWIQPLANQPFTRIQPDSTWKNTTHLGSEYAALLTNPGYQPTTKLVTLPSIGEGVAAIAVAQGRSAKTSEVPVIRFSGYDWAVRTAVSDHGGEPNSYDSANAWTDEHGYLHLRMDKRNGQWSCAEVSLTRSLGYGTYKFVIEDTKPMHPSSVLGFFTWDNSRSEGFHNEFDIELSQWDDPKAKNAQYAVQPFYVSENLARFNAPSGIVTHSFVWEPGKLSFQSFQGEVSSSGGQISGHRFVSGVPAPAEETMHIDLYEFHHAEHSSSPPVEVVIRSFNFTPLRP